MGLFGGKDGEDEDSPEDEKGGLGELFGTGNDDEGDSFREEVNEAVQDRNAEDRDDRLDVHRGSVVEFPESDHPPEKLVQRAAGNIDPKYLTDTGGRVIPWLNTPIIDYLEPDEQPEFVYADTGNDLAYEYPDGSSGTIGYATGAQFLVITDRRILYVNGAGGPGANALNDEVLMWSYDDIRQVAGKDSWFSDGIGFVDAEGGEFTFDITGNSDVADAIEYVRRKITAEGTDVVDPEVQELVENAEGKTVTRETVANSALLVALDDDEQLHHILEGNALLIEGGDKIEKKGGAGGSVTTAITDRRVFCSVDGGGSVTIPYDSITSIEYGLPPADEWEIKIPAVAEFGGQTEKLILHTQGRVYYLDLNERMGILPNSLLREEYQGISELAHEVMNFIRTQRENTTSQSAQTDSKSSDTDPLARIERLKELQEQGAITDEEFREKKADLLDQI